MLVFTLARQLPGHLEEPGGVRLGSAVLDLLTAALAARLDRSSDVPGETRRRALLLRIHGYIESRLGEPDLTPASIADAHHISLRYLHKLFQGEQTTVGDHIRRRRLEHCSRDLLDPALGDRPANAIALRWASATPRTSRGCSATPTDCRPASTGWPTGPGSRAP